VLGKRDDVGPEHEGALALAHRERPRGVGGRQSGVPDIGQFRSRDEVNRRPAQVGGVRALAAGGKTGGRQIFGTVAFTRDESLEYATQLGKARVASGGKRAIAL